MTKQSRSQWKMKYKKIIIALIVIMILFLVVLIEGCTTTHTNVSQSESNDINPSSSISLVTSSTLTESEANSVSSTSYVNSTTDSSSNTASQATPDIIPYISDVDFISSDIGYLCLAKSTSVDRPYAPPSFKLLKTLDSGKHWSVIGNNDQLCFPHFVDDKTGYGLLDTGYGQGHEQIYKLVKTVDGGVSWKTIDFMNSDTETLNGVIWAINVVNKDVMYIRTLNQIYKTVDECKSWTQINLPVDKAEDLEYPRDMYWVSSNEGYVLFELDNDEDLNSENSQKVLYYTSDGGKTWSSKGDLPLSGFENDMKFFSNGVGFMGFSNGSMVKTIDSGIHFSSITDYFKDSPAPDFININEGLGISRICSTDGNFTYKDT